MKTVLLFFLLVFWANLSAYGQKMVKVDVIYLQTDSIVEGHITDSIPGVSITMLTLHAEYLFIPLNEIKEIKTEIYIKSNEKLVPLSSDSLALTNRFAYWLWIQGGAGVVLSGDRSQPFQADIINGIITRDGLGFGVGIGSRFAERNSPVLVPIYLHLKTPVFKNNHVPIVAMGAGVVSNSSLEGKIGGPFFRVDIGFQKRFEPNVFFTFIVGFEQLNYYTEGTRYQSSYLLPTIDFNTANSLTLNLGIMF